MNLANKITIARIALVPLLILFLQPFPEWLVQRYGVFGLLTDTGFTWRR
ncbi:MAG: hypothetical protein K0R28_6913 [Paenibacillus sp.]|nr:hypothetical protein [Paenibacillus sp.]